MKTLRSPLLLLLTLVLLLIGTTPKTYAQTNSRITPVSVTDAGAPGNSWSDYPSISSDGRYIAFASNANNLVAGDSNEATDIFVYDRQNQDIERVSVSSTGTQGNALSTRPSISGNGRFVAFESLASNLVEGDTNYQSDIFIHDRSSGLTRRVSVSTSGSQGDGWSELASVSADGRYIAFLSTASNLVHGDNNELRDVFIHDTLTGHTLRASQNRQGEGGDAEVEDALLAADGTSLVFVTAASNLIPNDSNQVSDVFLFTRSLAKIERIWLVPGVLQPKDWVGNPSISAGGRYVAVVSPAIDLAEPENQGSSIFVHDRHTHQIPRLQFTELITAHTLSGNGHRLALISLEDESTFNLLLHDIDTGETQTLIQDVMQTKVAITNDGSAIAFVKEQSGVAQVFVYDENTSLPPTYNLTGRVTDSQGYPLALVTLSDGLGNTVKTDQTGFYYIGSLPPGDYTIAPAKEGYGFEPTNRKVSLSTDMAGINFTSQHEEVLEEARLDIGMPYSSDRGCANPWDGCGGPYHGFYAGYCTDLILDAYSFGVDYDIQFALEQDYRAKPEHYYRWRDSRNAHDMWRYFSYSGQMLPASEPYLPGDIVFFDWSEDGEIDHVALISEVASNGRPESMLDSTGVIDSNPSGLANELPWENLHERTVRGHARWTGIYEPVIPNIPEGEYLQMALSSPGATLNLISENRSTISEEVTTIPGGWFADLTWEQVISLVDPLGQGARFTAEITGGTELTPYLFTVQTLKDGTVTSRQEQIGEIQPGGTKRITLNLSLDDRGRLSLIEKTFTRKIRGKL